MKDKIRIGIFGARRGGSLAGNFYASGAEVVAYCDRSADAIAASKRGCPESGNAAEYADFDEFIRHDMDAVLVANYFPEHFEYAVKVMRAGKHVLSETTSNVTMAEGVALVRAKEETGMTYALFENYPWMKENQEMERVYKGGTLGNVVYAEGEYVHTMPIEDYNRLSPGQRHWRNWTTKTYYTTHALAPLMQMTDSIPTKVTAMASFHPEIHKGTAYRCGDAAAVVLCQTDTNAVFRVIGWGEFVPHGNSYRLCCTNGGMEVNKGNRKMRLIYNAWTAPEGKEPVTEYEVNWTDFELGQIAVNSGHGGADFFPIYHFIKDLEEGREPYWNVYRATTAASVGILSWRSVMNNNMSYDVPDFRKEEDRRKYEHDYASPYPDENFRTGVPCSSQPYEPTAEDIAYAESIWKDCYFRCD